MPPRGRLKEQVESPTDVSQKICYMQNLLSSVLAHRNAAINADHAENWHTSSTNLDVHILQVWDPNLPISRSYDRDKLRRFPLRKLTEIFEIFENSVLGWIDLIFNSFFAEG